MPDMSDAFYAQMARFAPSDDDIRTVAPVAPLLLQEGERRIREALAERDWLTAMAVAKRMAVTEGWREYLLACGKHMDAVWGSLGEVIMARLDRLKADDTEMDALDVAIEATTNPEDRLSLVQRYKQLEIMSEFLDYCRRTSHEVLAQAGGAEDPVLNLMGIIAMEAYLQNPALRQCGEDVGETIVKVLKPEHLR